MTLYRKIIYTDQITNPTAIYELKLTYIHHKEGMKKRDERGGGRQTKGRASLLN
jgi:hypothetical protein